MALFFALVAALILGILMIWGSDKTTDETKNWSTYYPNTVKGYMTLPDETMILNAIHTDTAIMGERFQIEFTLPTNKSPKEWLDQIQTESHIKKSRRKSDHLIDCCAECDLLRVEYQPERNRFIAEAGWD